MYEISPYKSNYVSQYGAEGLKHLREQKNNRYIKTSDGNDEYKTSVNKSKKNSAGGFFATLAAVAAGIFLLKNKGNIGAAVKKIGTTAKNSGGNTWTNLKDVLSKGANKAKTVVDDVVHSDKAKNLGNKAKSFGEKLKDLGKKAADGIKNGIKNAKNGKNPVIIDVEGHTVERTADAVKNTAKDAVAKATPLLTSAGDTLYPSVEALKDVAAAKKPSIKLQEIFQKVGMPVKNTAEKTAEKTVNVIEKTAEKAADTLVEETVVKETIKKTAGAAVKEGETHSLGKAVLQMMKSFFGIDKK